MMKKILLLVAAMIATTASFAQSHNVVTLTHEGNVQAFYGKSAFADAIAAAENGDYVTLSSGTFDATTIDKAVNIRGAGMWDDATDPENIIPQTIIEGNLIFNIPDEVTQPFSMEGVFLKGETITENWLRNTTFTKCYFNMLTQGSKKFKDVTFLNCYLMGYPYDNFCLDVNGSSIVAINCYIQFFSSNSSGQIDCSADIINCYLLGSFELFQYCYIRNSILSHVSTNHPYYMERNVLPSTTTCYNCVAGAMGTDANFETTWFRNCKGSGNTALNTVEGLTTDDYKLTDEAAALYIGTDGTQVGMYGGSSPFSAVPNYPRIKKLHVAQPQNGKIKVDIAVSSESAGE